MSAPTSHKEELIARCLLYQGGLGDAIDNAHIALQLRMPKTKLIELADKIKQAAEALRGSYNDITNHIDSCDQCPKWSTSKSSTSLQDLLNSASRIEAILRS